MYRVAIATSDTVDGDYTYLRSFRPLDHESRDIGQFIDDDGTAYLIFEDRPAKGFHIAKLSDDYLTVEKDMCLITAPIEGGAVVHPEPGLSEPGPSRGASMMLATSDRSSTRAIRSLGIDPS